MPTTPEYTNTIYLSMNYNDLTPPQAAKKRLVERRIKITQRQDDKLKELSGRIDVPTAVLVRMAIDAFIPRLTNMGFTEKGIKNSYLNNNYNY